MIDKLISSVKTAYKPLRKATYLEMLYDLVFIFCLQKTMPIMTAAAHSGSATLYTYYSYCFAFVLMMQIWFYSTMLMNQYGTGGTADRVCLVTNMLLIFVMSYAISENWENYMIFNMCWILILINYSIHWVSRIALFDNLSKQDIYGIYMTVVIMLLQAALVASSSLFSKVPAQVLCATAVLLGFVTWFVNNRVESRRTNFKHLSERCMLMIVMIFGQAIMGLAGILDNGYSFPFAVLVFALFINLLLIYLQEVDRSLDVNTIKNGTGYMAVTVWLGFAIFNMSTALMLLHGDCELPLSAYRYLGISICAYMLSFMMLIPYNKKSARRRLRIAAARVVACALLLVTFLLSGNHQIVGVCVAIVCAIAVLAHDRFVHQGAESNLDYF